MASASTRAAPKKAALQILDRLPGRPSVRNWRQRFGTGRRRQRGYGVAPKAVLRRLTHSQYNNTVRDLLKDNSDPASQFPPEDYVNGFKNQYEALSVSPILADAYSRAAERLAANAFRRGDSRGLIPCKPASEADAACRTQVHPDIRPPRFPQAAGAGRDCAYRGDLQRREDLSRRRAGRDRDHAAVAQLHFLAGRDSQSEMEAYAKASRLSYFIWDTAPDDALLDSAARGELNTPEGVERVARRMLDDPRAKDGVDEFVSEWLRFDRVMTASRERRLYPLFSRELAKSMTEEARRFIGDLVWNDRNFMDAFTAKYSFINSDLAAVYKTPPPARDFDRVEFPAARPSAPGLLGQALFLTLSSKPDEPAPTGRGLFIREQFLCQQVPPPPPGVDTNLPPVEESKPVTNRERMAMHATNKMCAGCHNLIDPIGFGFEKFDAIGMRREKHKLLFYPNADWRAAARRSQSRKRSTWSWIPRAQVAGIPGLGIYKPQGARRDPGEDAAVPGMHGQAGFSLHVRPAGYSRRQAGAEPGSGRVSQVRLPFQGIDGRIGKIEGISRLTEALTMSQVITKRTRLSRRIFLKGLTAAHVPGHRRRPAA